MSLESRAKKHFGVADHLQTKGWITPDGSLLNLGAHDHLDVLFQLVPSSPEPDGVIDQAFAAGFVRIGWSERQKGKLILPADRPLTVAQRKTLLLIVEAVDAGSHLIVEGTKNHYSVQALVGNRLAIAQALRGLNAAFSVAEVAF